MKVLVTGGTGFIGTRLALSSVDRGHDVIVLGQTNTPAEETNKAQLESAGITVVLGAITETEKLNEALMDCNLVFHLAAAQHEANVVDQHFYDVNVEGTRNIIEASIAAGVSRFVHGSTIGVYGSAMDGEIDEAVSPKPVNIYGVTKLIGEKLALSYADRIPLSVVRISETYGPGDRRLLKLFKAIDKQIFFMIGNGENKHQLIYVDDLIDGMYLAAEKDEALGQIFVMAGREVLSTNDMVIAISKALEVPLRKFRSPMWPFLLLAVIMEKTLSPLGIQPPLHRRRLDFFRKSFYFSCKKPEQLLNFEPKVDFANGTVETARWYKENGLM